MNAKLSTPTNRPPETQLVNLLAHHYGDGTVYLPVGTPREVFYTCLREGLLTDDGVVTRKGRELLARHMA